MSKTAVKSNSKVKAKPDSDALIASYMDYVLENEQTPKSVYKFAKNNNISEQDFYEHFGSFESLRKEIWVRFYQNTESVLNKSIEYNGFNNREKLLTFYYTLFEVLTANRSYVLYSLNDNDMSLKNMGELKSFRKHIKNFGKELIEEGNDNKSVQFLKQSETIFSEGVWLQFLFLLKFWKEDNSAGFESTDVAIEKSVNTAFDVFDSTPLERVVDFGKFLWKERMA